MITAERLTALTTLGHVALSSAINEAGHKNDRFLAAKFLGLTNGNQFCYHVAREGRDGELETAKVFLSLKEDGTYKASY